MTSRRIDNFPESRRGLGHVTLTIFGSTVSYPSASLASCSILSSLSFSFVREVLSLVVLPFSSVMKRSPNTRVEHGERYKLQRQKHFNLECGPRGEASDDKYLRFFCVFNLVGIPKK